jgi:hypothetical protein
MGLPILKVGIVVPDAVQSAKNYSAVFQLGPWTFDDVDDSLSVLNGEAVDRSRFGVRLAISQLGSMRIELI